MSSEAGILLGAGERPIHLLLRMANRHGLIAGATGTGKTVTLKVLAEGFSDAGVPVFVADVKGDIAGLARAGDSNPKMDERARKLGVSDYRYRASPVALWDVAGRQGHRVRATVSDMGPLLLARLLDLNATQEALLHLAFKVADEQGLLLLDLKDLRAMLADIGARASELTLKYGNVSKASVGAIQRALLVIDQQGGSEFFGEPALELADFLHRDTEGRGVINVLAADKLMETPKVYATMLLWLLAELFEELPEVGDPEKPKLVFFFDEAHLLFDDAPKALIEKVEQVVRLIRSKGIGIYFVTQNPLDIPDSVLGQLGNRVQHALRAFTPRDQKAVKAAADTFRPNPKLDTAQVITELAVGEALVSCLDAKGAPTPVERTAIRPPASRFGPLTPDERAVVIGGSGIGSRYDVAIDRRSAYEHLTQRTEARVGGSVPTVGRSREQDEEGAGRGRSEAPTRTREPASRSGRGRTRQSLPEAMAKSAARSIGSAIGREIIRNVLGAILKRR